MIADRSTWKMLRDAPEPPFGRWIEWKLAQKYIDGGAEVSKEDYDLGLMGVVFATQTAFITSFLGSSAYDPGSWLRVNLGE